jgi:hypothetical protein
MISEIPTWIGWVILIGVMGTIVVAMVEVYPKSVPLMEKISTVLAIVSISIFIAAMLTLAVFIIYGGR